MDNRIYFELMFIIDRERVVSNLDRQYVEYLQQLRLIEAFSSDEQEGLNRLYFQEMVLDSLTPKERESYMRFLLEPRPKNVEDALETEKFTTSKLRKSSFLDRLKAMTHKYFERSGRL